jgi:hypothetical protein
MHTPDSQKRFAHPQPGRNCQNDRPPWADTAKVEARLENGVLLVKLAKHESARPRKIVVKEE